MKIYLITENERQLIDAVKNRLYTENRMDGDEMRDNAQKLQAVIESMTEAD